MNKSVLKRISVLILICLVLSGCSSSNTSMSAEQPTESAETTPAASLIPATNEPVTSAAEQANEPLTLIEARLHSHGEAVKNTIQLNGKDVAYAGHGWISFHFSKLPLDMEAVSEMTPFFLINGEAPDWRSLSSDGNVLNLYLDDTLPEAIEVELKPGLTIEGAILKQGITQKLIHHKGLKVDIIPYDPVKKVLLPKGIYFSGQSRDFLITFSKPVDQSSVEVGLGENRNHKLKTEWLDDSRMLAHISGLDIWDSCSLEVLSGNAAGGSLYGDRIDRSIREDNTPALHFEIRPEKSLKAVDLASDKERVIRTFDQGMLANSLSPDRSKLAMGIITNADDGYFYTPCVLDFGSKNPELQMKPYNTLHNPAVEREYWTKDGQYASDLKAEILSVKSELTQNLYEWTGKGRYARETLKLGNGDIVMVQVQVASMDGAEQEIALVHATDDGKVLHTYMLPFKEKTGEGWLLFECDIEDLGDGRILATGYENPPSGPLSTYLIHLADQSMSPVVQTGDLIQRFSELGFSLYYGLNDGKNTDYNTICIIDFSGKLLKEINLPEEWFFGKAMVNPRDGRLYLFTHNSELKLSWKSYDTQVFEEKEGSRPMAAYFEPIDFLASGELLVLESPD